MSVDYSATTAQERALFRAVVESVSARHLGEGQWLTSSSSRPGQHHITTSTTCTCEAGQHGMDCKHRAAVAMAEQRTCSHCGHAGPDVLQTVEHVGGRGYVAVDRCDDPMACWERWDIAHGLGVA